MQIVLQPEDSVKYARQQASERAAVLQERRWAEHWSLAGECGLVTSDLGADEGRLKGRISLWSLVKSFIIISHWAGRLGLAALLKDSLQRSNL